MLPEELREIEDEIRGHAKGYGLDFFDVIFEILDFSQMNEVAAYNGFPTRYPHWKFGMEYERLQKSYAYGLHKIYEMVVNTDPCYAYLLACNNIVDQKTVIAHVFGHSDFFKNNRWFDRTNRKMLDEMANHATRMRNYVEKHGFETVENLLDICLSIENLIDHLSPFIKRKVEKLDRDLEEEESEEPRVTKLEPKERKEYMDPFLNPPDVIELERKKLEKKKQDEKKFPQDPEKDVLSFLISHAPLEKWQRDVLSIIQEESYYFAPQAQTKIMNEGWATFWHSKIMTQKVGRDSEIIDYADHHSGTLGNRPGRINPYKVGLELFRDIEDRWNKGKFGKDYEECDDVIEKRNWDKNLGQGTEKIFEVRKLYNDIGFIDTFMTEDFCEEQKLFTYRYNHDTGMYEIADRDFEKVKKQLLFSLTNFGQPFIYVQDGNYRNRGELYLTHKHEGVDLKLDYARDTLKNIQQIWQRPVHIETRIEDIPVLMTYDGKEHTERGLDGAKIAEREAFLFGRLLRQGR